MSKLNEPFSDKEINQAVAEGEWVLEDPEISEMVTRMEAEADAEILAGVVTLRWGKRQIETVKRAAAYMGIPYQTYLKQVVFRQALADIQQAEWVVGGTAVETRRAKTLGR